LKYSVNISPLIGLTFTKLLMQNLFQRFVLLLKIPIVFKVLKMQRPRVIRIKVRIKYRTGKNNQGANKFSLKKIYEYYFFGELRTLAIFQNPTTGGTILGKEKLSNIKILNFSLNFAFIKGKLEVIFKMAKLFPKSSKIGNPFPNKYWGIMRNITGPALSKPFWEKSKKNREK
jgi:hypothetical protein